MQTLQDDMSIYQQTLDEDKRLKQALERLEKQAKNQAQELPSLNISRGESLSEQLLLQHRSKLNDDYQSLQTKASEATKPRIKTAFSRDTVVDRLKLHKDDILGRLVDFVSVTEQKYIKVVSLACQDIIDAVITRDTASARHLYDAKMKALSLELIPPSNQNQSLLKQIQNPRFPQEFMRGNPKYLVSFVHLLLFSIKFDIFFVYYILQQINLLHVEPGFECIKDILLDELKDAIVFDDYQFAIKYREYLFDQRLPSPLLFALDGRKLGRTFDPNQVSATMDYVFGEYFEGKARLGEIQKGNI
jgi:hypothetical protein